jgi:hypothetical protein
LIQQFITGNVGITGALLEKTEEAMKKTPSSKKNTKKKMRVFKGLSKKCKKQSLLYLL